MARAFADGDVERAAAAMLQRQFRKAHHVKAQARLRKPVGDKPAKDASFVRPPEIAVCDVVRSAALARDDEHVPEAVCLAAGEEAAQNDVGILLPEAVKIEPRIDRMAAAGNPLAQARVERRMRR